MDIMILGEKKSCFVTKGFIKHKWCYENVPNQNWSNSRFVKNSVHQILDFSNNFLLKITIPRMIFSLFVDWLESTSRH